MKNLKNNKIRIRIKNKNQNNHNLYQKIMIFSQMKILKNKKSKLKVLFQNLEKQQQFK